MIKKSLCDICNPKQWKTISSDMLTETGYPVYGANGVIGYYTEYNHEKQTLLITCRGATCGTLNICRPYSYVNGNAMALDDLSEEIDLSYLFYYLSARGLSDVITGSAQPQIVRQSLKKVEICYPQLDTQRKIVAVLDKVSDLIAKRSEQLDKLDLLVKSKFVEMFGNSENPLPLSDVGTVTGGLTKNAKRENLELHLPYLRVANVFFAHIDTSEMLEIGLTPEERDKTILKDGDLLFVEGNGSPDQIGRVAIWHNEIPNCVHQNHLIKVRLDPEKVLPEFAMHYFMTQEGRNQIKKAAVSTSGLYTLSVSKIGNLIMPVPTLEQQNEFVSLAQQADKSKSAIQQSLEKLETLKKALMQEYFN